VSETTTYRILIVDDDEDARILLMRALGKSSLTFEVAAAADGLQALELVARAQPHAVITDIMMPRMNGFDLCVALRTDPATAHIPVIMVTALEDERDRQRGLDAGADEYLTKPFSWGTLSERLAELLTAAYAQRSHA
jgi:two-component system cell cycle response regulator